MVYFFLLFSLISLCIGQVLLKKSALGLSQLETPFHLALNPLFLTAVTIYALSMLSWLYVLQHLSLGRAYAFTSSAFILIPLLSHYFFGERLNIQFFLGAGLIIAGVILTVKS